MSNVNQDLSGAPIELKRNWGWLLGLGILFVILGVIGLGMVVSITLASMLVIGVLIAIAGAIQIVDAFRCRGWKAIVWHFLIAILYLFAAGVIIYDPFLASTIITAVLAWTLILIGTTRCFMAFSLKPSAAWGWLLFAGIAALILGVMILVQWPFSGLWVIGMLIAIELIVNGWAYIFLALAIRE